MAQPALTTQQGKAQIAAAVNDVQRLVVSPYAHLPWARYLLLRLSDEATVGRVREWIATLLPRISTAAARNETLAVNLAFSAEGLARLGAGPTTLGSFSRAFRQGMSGNYRSSILGDVGASAPTEWAWGRPGATPHLLVAVYTATVDDLAAHGDAFSGAASEAGVDVVHTIDSLFLPGGLEHFGFADGISQPVLAGTEWEQRADAPKWESVQPGEFVFGHRDESGFEAWGPMAGNRDLGKNGSYLVFRQLEQHVERFHAYVAGAAAVRGLDAERVASEFVGRAYDGRPLALGAPPGPTNDFGYEHDKAGLGCPLGAHVRRANVRNSTPKLSPEAEEIQRRSSNRHRILRRGRPYGPTDEFRRNDEPRGLVFIALNADIERQFEFIQHTWLNNPTFAGLCGEIDPITAEQPPAPEGGSFTAPAQPVRDRFTGLPSFTTTRGGAYFFLPGLRAIELIVRGEI